MTRKSGSAGVASSHTTTYHLRFVQTPEDRRADTHGVAIMKPRITLLTLGVDDLDRAVRFYRDGLGLKTEGIVGTQFEHGAVAFFELQAGLKLALWPRASLAHDAGAAGRRPKRDRVQHRP